MIIKAKVIPNSSVNKIEQGSDGVYKIRVKAVPKKGKANNEVVKLIAQHFNVLEKYIEISNPTSRLKLIHIRQE